LQWLKVLTFGFIVFASLHLPGYFFPVVGRFINDRLFVSGSTGSMFWTWLVVLSFSQALYNRRLAALPRVALVLVAVATMYVAFVVQNEWKSGWVPAAVGMGVVLALSSWRVAIALAVAGLLPAGMMLQGLISSDAYSYSTRLEAWQILGEIVRVNPILGLGSANYYWYTPLFPIRGYFVNFNSHSQYVDVVAQFGLLGLLAFIWFLWEIGRVVWRMLHADLADDFAHAYVNGAAGGFVAVVVAGFLGDWLFPFFYNVGMYGFRSAVLAWVFLGALVALEAMKLPRRPPAQEALL
jgi:O-antigen ligase